MAGKSMKVDEMLRAASAAQKAGNREKAAGLYAAVLEKFPGNTKARTGLKNTEVPAEKKVKSLFEPPQDTGPKSLAVLGNLSSIEDPIAAGLQAMRELPPSENANDLMAASKGNFTRKVSVKQTETPATVGELELNGRTAAEKGRHHEAIRIYRELLEIQPEFVEIINNLGLSLRSVGELEEAAKEFEKAIRINPEYAIAYANMALALTDLERFEEAIVYLKDSCRIDPEYALAWRNMGSLLIQLGRKDEAVENLETAIRLQPEYAVSYIDLIMVKKFKKGDPLIEQMRSILSRQIDDEMDQIYLNFSLGKALADIGDAENAFAHISRANRLTKKRRKYDISKDRLRFELIQMQFKAKSPLRLEAAEVSPAPVVPIFMVGMPRTGSSLIEQVLACHSSVHGGGELPIASPVMNSVMRKAALSPDRGFDKKTLHRFREAYLAKAEEIAAPAKYMTDKNLLNFRYVGYILSAMPEAIVISLSRDAVATCWSNYKHYFLGSGISFAFDQNDVAEYYKLYSGLMNFWKRKYPGRIIDVDYDAFTQDQEGETRKLLKNCGLKFEQACLEFHKSKRSVKTASALQVRNKVYQGSSQEWEKYRPYLKPMIDALGYEK